MTDGDNRLYEFLPEIYRLRDTERDLRLHQVFKVLTKDHEEMLADIAKLYDNWFIETCAPDVIPELGALVGVQNLTETGIDRALVADAATLSGRKGTIAALEMITADVVRWPARVLEAALSIAVLASVRFPDILPHRLPDLRKVETGGRGRTRRRYQLPDVRDVGAPRTSGRGKMTSIFVVLWRLRPDTTTNAEARQVAPGRFTFDPLGSIVQLAINPVPRQPGAELVADIDVPAPIGRNALARHLAQYYGPGRSINVSINGRPVPLDDVVVGDLSRWQHRSSRRRHGYEHWRRHHSSTYGDDSAHDYGHTDEREHYGDEDERPRRRSPEICIDPELGRITVAGRDSPNAVVRVTYSRLAAGEVGSGHHLRGHPVMTRTRLRVRADEPSDPENHRYRSIRAAVDAWTEQRAKGAGDPEATIEILDDAVYEESLKVELFAGECLEIRAAPWRQPIIVPTDDRGERHRVHLHGNLERRPVTGKTAQPGPAAQPAAAGHPPQVRLSGLQVWGGLHVAGPLTTVTLEHCTLVQPAGRDSRGRREPSIRMDGAVQNVVLESCIAGPIRVDGDDAERSRRPDVEPVDLQLSDSLLDACDRDEPAIYGPRRQPAVATLRLSRCTVFGSITTRAVDSVIDSIITGRLDSARRQQGEVSFSFLGLPSKTPQRRHCQPDDALAQLASSNATGAAAQAVLSRVKPVFDSQDFGQPAYGRLSPRAPVEVTAGAHDGGELGVFHDEWSAARLSLLRSRLADFVPVGTDFDIRFAT